MVRLNLEPTYCRSVRKHFEKLHPEGFPGNLTDDPQEDNPLPSTRIPEIEKINENNTLLVIIHLFT